MTAVASVRAYRAVATTAARQVLSERAALAARVALFAVLLLIFSRLWLLVAERGDLPFGAADLLWYLAVTEWIVLSLPPLHLDLEADVRSGDVVYRLQRPASYLGARLAEAAGDALLRLLTLGVAGFGFAYALTGALPGDPRGLLLVPALGLLAVWLGLVSHALVGVSAFWLHDCSPLYWVWQKLAFILGGLMLPLEIYPDWLRELALWTPFAAMLHGPGQLALGFEPARALGTAVRLLLWGALATALLAWVYRRALARLEVGGG